jgi:hypothetical protein
MSLGGKPITVGELVRHLQELGIEAQGLPVFRADSDYGPVPATEVKEHPMYTYKYDFDNPKKSYYIDYFEFEDEDHTKMRGVQIR